ncbi:exopolysaccharide biosynthesis polyprenyl glycosylphosphotransferase [Gemmatirosa kalamazoonensis]|uniref:Exopolysaccharide biosynthesis polyprenyl glycosylphosphotransferase n=1 Tax=Gemmatirosa kalamazoonensis TaxID=861299 RepID=W0RKR2_9BACT|nr:exopolysaccharide biosynthesis polyprenyl glycosylphosphotransferase [Gemmatirosa kalamazoonensis]AHG91027.1 exopolysaccharide biosynthesis polyprenyl glycosylphosphotransferase [Gemmatirosa kalamazoonensis]
MTEPSHVSAFQAENGTIEHGRRSATTRHVGFVPIPTFVEPNGAVHVTVPGLRSHDVRLLGELSARRLLAFRCRAALGALTRLLVDASLLAGVAALVRHGFSGPGAEAAGAPSVVSALLIALLALGAAGEYEILGRRHHSLATPIVACSLLAVVLPMLAADIRTGWRGESLVALALGMTTALTALVWLRRRFSRGASSARVPLRGAVLVGRERDMAAAVAALGGDGARIVDRVAMSRGAVRGGVQSRLARRLAAGDVSEVVVVSATRSLVLQGIAAACQDAGARCIVALDARSACTEPGIPCTVGGHPATELTPAEVQVPRFLLKRVVDVVLTLLLLPVALPLGIVIAIAIRLETPGAVLFRQRRVGLGGREFVIWKFRSMRAEAPGVRARLAHLNHYGEAPLFKLKRDPRTTRVGRLLRRTSLDELPQLVNVLRGEMSLVGPRPPLPEEVACYAPHHFARLTVIPGMTGPWQVGGRNLITDFEQIVRMERDYIESWSLGLDFNIMLRTIGVVVTGTGAY